MVLYNFIIYFVSTQCWFAFQDSGTEMGLCHILHCALAMKDPYVTVRTVWRCSRPFLSHGLLFRSDIKPVGSWERNVPKVGNAFLAGFWLFFDRLSRPWPLRWKGHKGHFKSLQHSSITSDIFRSNMLNAAEMLKMADDLHILRQSQTQSIN